MKYITTVDSAEYRIEIINERRISVNGRESVVDFKRVADQPVYSLIVDGQSYEAFVYPGEAEMDWEVLLKGRHYTVTVEDERAKGLKATAGKNEMETGEFHLKAPMPGLVVSVSVEEGQEIQKGHVMMILESMKMQNELKAPRNGIVGRVRIKPGESVEQRQVLLSIH